VAALGPGIVAVLPADACGLVEMARVVRYMANEGARQCGPCLHGLPALADALDRLVLPSSGDDAAVAVAQLLRWCDQIDGRGACNHPSGVVQFVRSGVQTFSDDVVRHTAEGGCDGVTHAPVLPL
jgi:NADH:ubiquinone oxidoreductase subunit F (NADH-binding)